MTMHARFVIIMTITTPFVVMAEPELSNDPRPLIPAISKSLKKIETAGTVPDSVNELFRQLKVFEGDFLLAVEQVKHDENKERVIVSGVLRVPRGSSDRYRTADEKTRIADKNAEILEAQNHLNSVKNPGHTDDKAFENQRPRKVDSNALHSAQRRLKELQSEHKALISEVKKAEQKRRDLCERIEIEIVAPLSFKTSMDWTKKKIPMSAFVSGGYIDTEPPEIGGLPRIKRLILCGDLRIKNRPEPEFVYLKNDLLPLDAIEEAMKRGRIVVGMSLENVQKVIDAKGKIVRQDTSEMVYTWTLAEGKALTAWFREGKLNYYEYANP